MEASIFHTAALNHGLCVIAIDRPGMGSSQHQVGRRLLDFPADVTALADHLGIASFGVLGVSGGGPYVLASCHALPSARLRAAGIIAGLYPRALGLRGMLPEARMLLYMAPWLTRLVEKGLESALSKLARDSSRPEAFEAALAKSFSSRPAVDRAVWDNDLGFRQALVASTREALSESSRGAAWEARLFGSDWGFGLADVNLESRSLSLWHGALDRNSPLAMAQKAVELLRGAELHVSPNDAHASLVMRKADEAISTLKQRL